MEDNTDWSIKSTRTLSRKEQHKDTVDKLLLRGIQNRSQEIPTSYDVVAKNKIVIQ